MSEAVKWLVSLASDAAAHYRNDGWHIDATELEAAIAAVEAELNAVPAVTDKQGFDGRSTDYPDYVENYR